MLAGLRIESNMLRSGEILLMTMIILSSTILQVRQTEPEEVAAAHRAQDRIQHAEVGGLLLFYIICCSTI